MNRLKNENEDKRNKKTCYKQYNQKNNRHCSRAVKRVGKNTLYKNSGGANAGDTSNKLDSKKMASALTAVFVVQSIIIVVLLGDMYMTRNKLLHMTNQISYLSDTSNVILSDVGNMQTDIKATLEEEASLLEDWNIKVASTDFSKGTYTVNIVVVPKQYTDKTETVIYFGTKEFKLALAGYQYIGVATLPLSKGYDGNVTVLFTNGSKKSTEVLSSYEGIQPKFEGMFSGAISEMPSYEDGKLKIDSECKVYIPETNNYGFTNVNYVVEVNGVRKDVIDITRYLADEIESGEDKDQPNINSPEDLEKSQPDTESIIKEISPVYAAEAAYEHKAEYEVEEGAEVRLFIEGVCQEGYTFAYDLFNGKVNEGTEDEPAEGFEESVEYFKPNACVRDKNGYKLELE